MFRFLSILFMLGSLYGAHAETFQPFTGKILGSKVRMRIKPDLNAHIVCQCDTHDLVLVVGQDEDFWKIAPPPEIEAYIFRSYILDDVVEAHRVNVRLEPNVQAPVIAQLNPGDRISGTPCTENSKWLEIDMPQSVCFFIAKELLTYAGPPEYLASKPTSVIPASQNPPIPDREILSEDVLATQTDPSDLTQEDITQHMQFWKRV